MITLLIILLGLLLLAYIVSRIGDYEPPPNAERPIPPGENWDFHDDGQIIITVNPRQGENLPRT